MQAVDHRGAKEAYRAGTSIDTCKVLPQAPGKHEKQAKEG